MEENQKAWSWSIWDRVAGARPRGERVKSYKRDIKRDHHNPFEDGLQTRIAGLESIVKGEQHVALQIFLTFDNVTPSGRFRTFFLDGLRLMTLSSLPWNILSSAT